MKHLLILTLTFFAFTLCSNAQTELPVVNTDSLTIDSTSASPLGAYATVVDTINNEKVYICNSKGSSKYHYNKNCKGLNACKAEVKQLPKSEAIALGKKDLCGFE
jgi:hypothetical protein